MEGRFTSTTRSGRTAQQFINAKGRLRKKTAPVISTKKAKFNKKIVKKTISKLKTTTTTGERVTRNSSEKAINTSPPAPGIERVKRPFGIGKRGRPRQNAPSLTKISPRPKVVSSTSKVSKEKTEPKSETSPGNSQDEDPADGESEDASSEKSTSRLGRPRKIQLALEQRKKFGRYASEHGIAATKLKFKKELGAVSYSYIRNMMIAYQSISNGSLVKQSRFGRIAKSQNTEVANDIDNADVKKEEPSTEEMEASAVEPKPKSGGRPRKGTKNKTDEIKTEMDMTSDKLENAKVNAKSSRKTIDEKGIKSEIIDEPVQTGVKMPLKAHPPSLRRSLRGSRDVTPDWRGSQDDLTSAGSECLSDDGSVQRLSRRNSTTQRTRHTRASSADSSDVSPELKDRRRSRRQQLGSPGGSRDSSPGSTSRTRQSHHKESPLVTSATCTTVKKLTRKSTADNSPVPAFINPAPTCKESGAKNKKSVKAANASEIADVNLKTEDDSKTVIVMQNCVDSKSTDKSVESEQGSKEWINVLKSKLGSVAKRRLSQGSTCSERGSAVSSVTSTPPNGIAKDDENVPGKIKKRHMFDKFRSSAEFLDAPEDDAAKGNVCERDVDSKSEMENSTADIEKTEKSTEKDMLTTVDSILSSVDSNSKPVDNNLNSLENTLAPMDNMSVPIKSALSSTENVLHPTEDTVTPLESTLTTLDNAIAPLESTVSPMENTTVSIENTLMPMENTLLSVGNSLTPMGNTLTPIENTLTPMENTLAPMENTLAPMENTMAPMDNTLTSMENTLTHMENALTPLENYATVESNASAIGSCDMGLLSSDRIMNDLGIDQPTDIVAQEMTQSDNDNMYATMYNAQLCDMDRPVSDSADAVNLNDSIDSKQSTGNCSVLCDSDEERRQLELDLLDMPLKGQHNEEEGQLFGSKCATFKPIPDTSAELKPGVVPLDFKLDEPATEPWLADDSKGGRWEDDEELAIEKALTFYISSYTLPLDDACVQAMRLHPILRARGIDRIKNKAWTIISRNRRRFGKDDSEDPQTSPATLMQPVIPHTTPIHQQPLQPKRKSEDFYTKLPSPQKYLRNKKHPQQRSSLDNEVPSDSESVAEPGRDVGRPASRAGCKKVEPTRRSPNATPLGAEIERRAGKWSSSWTDNQRVVAIHKNETSKTRQDKTIKVEPITECGQFQSAIVSFNVKRRGVQHYGRQGIRKRLLRHFTTEPKAGGKETKRKRKKGRRRNKWARGSVTKPKVYHSTESKYANTPDTLIDIINEDGLDMVVKKYDIHYLYPSNANNAAKGKRRGRPKKKTGPKAKSGIAELKSNKIGKIAANTDGGNVLESTSVAQTKNEVLDSSTAKAYEEMVVGSVVLTTNLETSEIISSKESSLVIPEEMSVMQQKDKKEEQLTGDNLAEKLVDETMNDTKISTSGKRSKTGGRKARRSAGWTKKGKPKTLAAKLKRKETSPDNINDDPKVEVKEEVEDNSKDKVAALENPSPLKMLASQTMEELNKSRDEVEFFETLKLKNTAQEKLSINVVSTPEKPNSLLTTAFRSPRVPFHLDDDVEALPVQSPDSGPGKRKRLSSTESEDTSPSSKKQLLATDIKLAEVKVLLGPRCRGLKPNARKSMKRVSDISDTGITVKLSRRLSAEDGSDSSSVDDDERKHGKKSRSSGSRKKKWFVLTQGDKVNKIILRKGTAGDERRHSIDIMESGTTEPNRHKQTNYDIKMFGSIEEMMKQCQICYVKIPDILQCLNIGSLDLSNSSVSPRNDAQSESANSSFTKLSVDVTTGIQTVKDSVEPRKLSPYLSSDNKVCDSVIPPTTVPSVLKDLISKYSCNSCSYNTISLDTVHNHVISHIEGVDTTKLSLETIQSHYSETKIPRPADQFGSLSTPKQALKKNYSRTKEKTTPPGVGLKTTPPGAQAGLKTTPPGTQAVLKTTPTGSQSLKTISPASENVTTTPPASDSAKATPTTASDSVKTTPPTSEAVESTTPTLRTREKSLPPSRVNRPRIPSLPVCDPTQAFFQCAHCTYASNEKEDVREHVLSQHRTELNFSCPYCEKRQEELIQSGTLVKKSLTLYKQAAYMRRHISTLHPKLEMVLRLQDGFYYVAPGTVELKAYPPKRSTPTPPPMQDEGEKVAKLKIGDKLEERYKQFNLAPPGGAVVKPSTSVSESRKEANISPSSADSIPSPALKTAQKSPSQNSPQQKSSTPLRPTTSATISPAVPASSAASGISRTSPKLSNTSTIVSSSLKSGSSNCGTDVVKASVSSVSMNSTVIKAIPSDTPLTVNKNDSEKTVPREPEYIELSQLSQIPANVLGGISDAAGGSGGGGNASMSRPSSTHTVGSEKCDDKASQLAEDPEPPSSPQLMIVNVMSLAEKTESPPSPAVNTPPTKTAPKKSSNPRGFSTIDEAEGLISAEIESEEEDDSLDEAENIVETSHAANATPVTTNGLDSAADLSARKEFEKSIPDRHESLSKVKSRPVGTVAGTPVDARARPAIAQPKPTLSKILENSKLHMAAPPPLISGAGHPPRAVVPGTVRTTPVLNVPQIPTPPSLENQKTVSPPSDEESSSTESDDDIPKEAFKVFNLKPKFNLNMPTLAPKPSLVRNSLPNQPVGSTYQQPHHGVPPIGQNLMGRGHDMSRKRPQHSPPPQDPIWRQFSALQPGMRRPPPYNEHTQQAVNSILASHQRTPANHPSFFPRMHHGNSMPSAVTNAAVMAQHSRIQAQMHLQRPPIFPARSERRPSEPHNCPYCPYQVSDMDALHDHILAHGAEKINWSCPYCPQPNQMSKNFVAKHIKSAHPGFHVVYIPFGVKLQ